MMLNTSLEFHHYSLLLNTLLSKSVFAARLDKSLEAHRVAALHSLKTFLCTRAFRVCLPHQFKA